MAKKATPDLEAIDRAMAKPPIDDGGAAFPREDYQADNAAGQRGMSLRAYFAAKAMAALFSQQHAPGQPLYETDDPAQARSLAYLAVKAADALIAELKA